MSNERSKIKLSKSIEGFILHLHPMRIDKRAVKFSRTFGLGGISALLFIILCVSGIILRFSYSPSVSEAYNSVKSLQANTLFGQFIRNIHYISAQLMIAVTFLHMIRTYYSTAIYNKRAHNWIIGLCMFLLVMASNFTGYLLPWDQLAYWAVTVITQLIEYIPLIGMPLANFVRGSSSVDGNTLLNFYTLHTGVIPLLFVCLMSIHFWLIRKANGIALPKVEKSKKVNVNPNLIWIEILAACIVIGGILLVSVFYNAPLMEQADMNHSPNPTKAPWYFLGAQKLLLHIHPIFGALIIPIGVIVFFVYLPYFRYNNLNTGVWFNSPEGKKVTIQSSIFSFIFTFILIVLLDKVIILDNLSSTLPIWIYNGLIPFLLYLLPIGAYIYYLIKNKKIGKTEIIMACTSILLASYICMMLISIFLRAEGMKLIF